MKPHTAHQRQVDDSLTTALSNVAAALRQVHVTQRAAAASDAAMMREIRSLSRRLDVLAAGSVDQYGRDVVGLAEHVDALARRTDELTATQARLDRIVRPPGLLPSEGGGGGYPEAPPEPWTEEYNERHATFVASELDDTRLLTGFREGSELPPSFATGFDERVVEFPWVVSRALEGRVLDAGSTLNHPHVLARVRERMRELHVVTLAPEEQSFTQLGVSYVFADLRELPFRSGTYDRVVSISTLEHVGMDNEYYGDGAGPAVDPQAEARRAMAELARVVRGGGDLYFTVPVGRGERYPWVRNLTLDELDDLIDAFGGEPRSVAFYRHDADGWQLADRDDVGDAHYRDHLSGVPVGDDRTVAAEAVACVHLVAPAAASGDGLR